jgi:hypothetical protein
MARAAATERRACDPVANRRYWCKLEGTNAALAEKAIEYREQHRKNTKQPECNAQNFEGGI